MRFPSFSIPQELGRVTSLLRVSQGILYVDVSRRGVSLRAPAGTRVIAPDLGFIKGLYLKNRVPVAVLGNGRAMALELGGTPFAKLSFVTVDPALSTVPWEAKESSNVFLQHRITVNHAVFEVCLPAASDWTPVGTQQTLFRLVTPRG